MKNQLHPTFLFWVHWLNYGNFQFQFHSSLSRSLYKETMTTQIADYRYVPTIPRFFRLQINSLQSSHLSGFSFSHTQHHYVLIVQHFFPPNPIAIIKPFSKPFISSSFSSTCLYIMHLPTPKRGLWCNKKTRLFTLKIPWN